MISIKRTNSNDQDFLNLILELDNDLNNRYNNVSYEYNANTKVSQLDTVVVAFMADTAVGCSCFKQIAEHTVEFKRMFVNPYLRGMGIGAAIMKALMEWAREMKFEKAVLETGKKQPESIRLAMKHGFVIVPNFAPYTNSEVSVCMSVDLNKSSEKIIPINSSVNYLSGGTHV